MIYYLEKIIDNENHAGSKAVNDITNILKKRQDTKPIRLKDYRNYKLRSLLNIFQIFTFLFKSIFIKRKSYIVFQQESVNRSTYLMIKLFSMIAKLKKIKRIVIIHDLYSIRYNKPDKGDTLLKSYDYIICHNNKMKAYILTLGINEDKIITLDIFDYLFEGSVKEKTDKDVITIAGNLDQSKAGYIGKLPYLNNPFDMFLYGVNYKGQDTEYITYKGVYTPEALIENIDGKFGLIWDGNSIETCDGMMGHYLKFNNPHKTSMYIVSHMPIIVWKEAAIADFVRTNNIGLTISSLEEINQVMKQVSDKDYQTMKNNVKELAEKLKTGYYTNKALDTVLESK